MGSPEGARHELMTGPFVLRTLLDNVPLSEDGDDEEFKINCVDYLGERHLRALLLLLLLGACVSLTDHHRRQPLHRHLRLRALALRPDPARSCRSVRPACLYTCVEAAPKLCRKLCCRTRETRCPANPLVDQGTESVRALQQYRHLLRPSGA